MSAGNTQSSSSVAGQQQGDYAPTYRFGPTELLDEREKLRGQLIVNEEDSIADPDGSLQKIFLDKFYEPVLQTEIVLWELKAHDVLESAMPYKFHVRCAYVLNRLYRFLNQGSSLLIKEQPLDNAWRRLTRPTTTRSKEARFKELHMKAWTQSKLSYDIPTAKEDIGLWEIARALSYTAPDALRSSYTTRGNNFDFVPPMNWDEFKTIVSKDDFPTQADAKDPSKEITMEDRLALMYGADYRTLDNPQKFLDYLHSSVPDPIALLEEEVEASLLRHSQ
jgi:hypothetical protein